MHTPGNAQKAGMVGGRRRAIFNPDQLQQFSPPKNPSALLDVVATTIVDVRQGRMDPKAGNTIAVLAGVCHQLTRSATLEERVGALERKKG